MLSINCTQWVKHEFAFGYFGVATITGGKKLVLSEDSEPAATKPRWSNLTKMCRFKFLGKNSCYAGKEKHLE